MSLKKEEKLTLDYDFLEVKKQKIIEKTPETKNVHKPLQSLLKTMTPDVSKPPSPNHETNSQANIPILETMQIPEEPPSKKMVY